MTTTTLEIINEMLAVNGETPVSSASSTNPAAIQARNALARVNRTVQARGWWFNKEPGITLAYSLTTGEVMLPSNTLSVDPVNSRSNLVQRGTRLYDRKNSTYNIGESVIAEVTLLLPIEDLPQTAASYIAAKAVKEHYIADDGDKDKATFLQTQESECFAYLQREHLTNENITNTSSRMGRYIQNAIYSGGERLINFDGE